MIQKRIKIGQKVTIIFTIIVLFISAISGFYNDTKAVVAKEVKIYEKDRLKCFKVGGGSLYFISYEYEDTDNVRKPAYCLNLKSFSAAGTDFSLKINKNYEDVRVWKIIRNGYPFCSLDTLGCTIQEAQMATQLAIYIATGQYRWEEIEAITTEGKTIIEVAHKIVKAAEAFQETRPVGNIEIKPLDDLWQKEKKGYISKTYKADITGECLEYSVELQGDRMIDAMQVTNEKGVPQTQFKKGENFKVLIPVSILNSKYDKTSTFGVSVTANIKTMPVLFGGISINTYSDYALVTDEWETMQVRLEQEYFSNKTTIKIVKQDAETLDPLANAKFNILDEDKKVVYTELITDGSGICEMFGIDPGKYYIEELYSPMGYTKYKELIEIDVGYNATYTVTVKNYAKPTTGDKHVDQEVTVIGEKVPLLPNTGF